MVTPGTTNLQVIGLPEDAQLVARLRAGFAPAGQRPRHILAQGDEAETALRAALAGEVLSVVLLAPPPVAGLDAGLRDTLLALQVPVLVLLGSETPEAMAAAGDWRRAAPKAFVTFVFGAGAGLATERPQAVATLVADFFTRGENFLVKVTEDRLYP
jgi:pimeloyl-ACP methyl ester carboxylesterase